MLGIEAIRMKENIKDKIVPWASLRRRQRRQESGVSGLKKFLAEV
jgi:hypothetical protein